MALRQATAYARHFLPSCWSCIQGRQAARTASSGSRPDFPTSSAQVANIALPVAAYALVANDKTVDERLSKSRWELPFLLLLLVLMFFALALLRRGRRTEALTAPEARASCGR